MALELPVLEFIKARLQEADATLEVRAGTAYYDLFIKPQQLMLQPLFTAMETSLTAQSVKRIQATTDPDSFDEDLVDELTTNLYVFRDPGVYATTTVRAYYSAPVDKQFPAGSAEFLTSTGLSYFNSTDITITKAEMILNTSGSLYYVDIPVKAQNQGTEYNVDIGGIVVFVNDVDAVSVSNLAAASNGHARETNSELLARVEQSIGVRDFETGKGINAIINEKYPGIFDQIVAIGFGDQEMMRDIVYNAHVGGNTDVYLKTPILQTLTKDVVGLEFDDTREVNRTTYKQLTALNYSDANADLNTPFIVVGTMSVKSDDIETAASTISASIPAVTGVNLVGNEYIKLKLDSTGTATNIKVSGANPSSTQKFEIINSINAALGQTVASAYGADKIKLQSQVIGFGSELNFYTPDAPRTDASLILFPSLAALPVPYVSGVTGVTPNPPAQLLGIVATTYIETADYSVDYLNGKIKKLPGSAILSGDTIVGPASNGVVSTGSDVFSTPVPSQFALVQPGDEIIVTASTSLLPGTYIVKEKVTDQVLKLQGVTAPSNDAAVSYKIISNQVVILKYKYNPLSVDIGGKVLLADGRTRGVRPGREDFTITNTPFIDIVSIEEIDPDTLEGLNVFISSTKGYGGGGYGVGPYGVGKPGDYRLIVNSPKDRFSVFEDSMLLFDPALLGKSYRISYYGAPEVALVHDTSRSDLERVTGADVLPKNFVPAFIDVTVKIQRDSTNINTPTTAVLAQKVADLINAVPAGTSLKASNIVQMLKDYGLKLVQVPFTMYMTVANTDGSTTLLSDQNELILPDVALPRATDNYVTPKITHFYSRNVSLVEL